MTLEIILARRRQEHFKKLSKYLKYVLNDHFVLILVFLLGALAYQYSEFIKGLTGDFYLGKIIVALLLPATVFMGRLATLATAADPVFLAIKEKEWQASIATSKKRSLLIPAITLFLLTAAAMPILFVGQPLSLSILLIIFSIGIVLKWFDLNLQEVNLRFDNQKQVQNFKKGLYFFGVLVYLVAFFITPFLGLLVVVLGLIGSQFKIKKMQEALIDWELTVKTEENRIAKINRLLNLFIDAPSAKDHAKRRKYLDGLVKRLSGNNQAFQYLFARLFTRGNDYFPLFLRLTGIGVFVLVLTKLPMISIFLNVLILYLTGFQILPLYSQLSENAMVNLYPQDQSQKLVSFSRVMRSLLLVEGLIFSIASFIGVGLKLGFLSLLVNSIFAILFAEIYTKKRLRK